MAPKLRLEYPGACYHVLNRGNYRVDISRTIEKVLVAEIDVRSGVGLGERRFQSVAGVESLWSNPSHLKSKLAA